VVRLQGFKKKYPFEYYLVGGQVRDQLLGLSSNDYDYVVVGSTPEILKKHGLIQVGKSFPVFIDPKNQDEYALARKEIKIGNTHQSFEFVFDPSITLQEDLIRRDFTVNAICMKDSGELIDYFGGLEDLKQKTLKHISPHFSEDPLRVFRAAKFSAKLNFSLHPTTLKLCQKMVSAGELQFLSMERIKAEFDDAFMIHRFAKFVAALKAMHVWNTDYENDFPDPAIIDQVDSLEYQWVAAGILCHQNKQALPSKITAWKNKYKISNSIESSVKIFLQFMTSVKQHHQDTSIVLPLLSAFQDGKNQELIHQFSHLLKGLKVLHDLENDWLKFQQLLEHFKKFPWDSIESKSKDFYQLKCDWLNKFFKDKS
jgi:tRNA nucleotidyltransferase/poly(A) polymerase